MIADTPDVDSAARGDGGAVVVAGAAAVRS